MTLDLRDIPSGMELLASTLKANERRRVLEEIWDRRIEIVMGGVETLRRVIDEIEGRDGHRA